MMPLNTFALLAFFLNSHLTKAHPKNDDITRKILSSLINSLLSPDLKEKVEMQLSQG